MGKLLAVLECSSFFLQMFAFTITVMVKAVSCVLKFSRVESGKGFFHIKTWFLSQREIFLSSLLHYKNSLEFPKQRPHY